VNFMIYDIEDLFLTAWSIGLSVFALATIPPVVIGSIALTKHLYGFL
jgi:hypothetical protein